VAQLEDSITRRDNAMSAFNISEHDFCSFVDAERKYLSSLPSERAEETNAIDYITALEAKEDLESVVSPHLHYVLVLISGICAETKSVLLRPPRSRRLSDPKNQ
jgi:hypothetical protein